LRRGALVRNKTSLVLTVLIAGTPLWADSRDLHWSELSAFVADHSVALTLADGARIEGKPIAVEPEELVMDVRKTSDARAHPKGRQSIPRDQAKSLVVNRSTIRWRIVGVCVGAAAGVPVGVVAAFEREGIFSKGNDGTGVIIAVVAGLAAAGLLIGWATDHRKTTVTVVP
jgi:hypothetical protein